MNPLGPLNLVNLLAVGTLLFLALSIIDSRRSGVFGPGGLARDADPIRIGLGVIAGLLTVAGLLGAISAIAGPITVPISVIAFVLGILAIRQYFRAERQAVLPYLAVAVERGMPLATAMRAYAFERHDQFGRRGQRLAELLESGARLPAAMRLSGHRLGLAAVLAVGVGDDFHCLDMTLRKSMRDEQRLRQVLRHIGERLAYLAWVAAMTLGIHGVFSLELLPRLYKINDEFGLPSGPTLAAWTFSIPGGGRLELGHYLVDFGIVPALAFITTLGGFALVLMGEFWWRWLPLFGRLSLGHDSSWILRALGWGVAQKRSATETLASIAQHLPTGIVQRRVQRAVDAVRDGARWTAALRGQRLITAADEALLTAAEDAGNLAWACEHRADSRLRLLEYRWQRGISILFPVVIVLAAIDVFSLCVGIFQFLTGLMETLA